MGITNSSIADTESSEPVKVISMENQVFQLHADELKLILENDNIKDHYVMVLSIAGAFQKGNSFVSNIFLRYLEAQYKRHSVTDWLAENGNGSTLKGFHYQYNQNSKSNGIWMWSELFTHTFDNGDKVAVVLIDTQELSDHNKITRMDSDATFAMSILLSSVQCYIVNQNIQEDDLRRLQLIAESGQLVRKQSNAKPFQKLLFIFRDWPHANELDYGWNGEKEVERNLATGNDHTQNIQMLINWIKSSFGKIDGFLLPYPGNKVVYGNFSDDIRRIDPIYRKYVEELVVGLVAPENIIIKQINGRKIRAHELSQYLREYLNAFSCVESVRAQDIYHAMMVSGPRNSIAEQGKFEKIIQVGEAAQMERAQKLPVQDETELERPDVWSKFGKLVNLDINVDGASPDEKQQIYANSRNHIKLVITIGIEDDEGKPLNVGAKDLKDRLYLCDYETQKKLELPWKLSDVDNIVTGGDQIFVYKFISCATIEVPSEPGNFSVGVCIPHVGEFDTSHHGTKTQNGKSGSTFRSPKRLAITAYHEIDYSKQENLKMSIGDFETVSSNLGWTSRFSREGPYVEHKDGICERRQVYILPNDITGQQEFKKYEILEYNGIKNDEVNQFSAVWGPSNQPAEKCFDLITNGRDCEPCAVIGSSDASNYHVNVWFPPNGKEIHIDGHVWTEDFFYFYRFCPCAVKSPIIITDNGERGAVMLSLYKFKLPVGGSTEYGWKDVIRTVKIKVTDLYENEGTFELIFDDANNFDKPGFK